MLSYYPGYCFSSFIYYLSFSIRTDLSPSFLSILRSAVLSIAPPTVRAPRVAFSLMKNPPADAERRESSISGSKEDPGKECNPPGFHHLENPRDLRERGRWATRSRSLGWTWLKQLGTRACRCVLDAQLYWRPSTDKNRIRITQHLKSSEWEERERGRS